jgi:hypothetical protein
MPGTKPQADDAPLVICMERRFSRGDMDSHFFALALGVSADLPELT